MDRTYICWHTFLIGTFLIKLLLTWPLYTVESTDKISHSVKQLSGIIHVPRSQARLGLIGSLVPYVTYNLCSACTAGREGQRSPWAKVAMGTTSRCSSLSLSAALTHLKAELSRISLCQARILLLYFLTLLCSFSSLCFLSPCTQQRLQAEALGHLHACWHIHV